jgi:uncharacterized protein DUF4340
MRSWLTLALLAAIVLGLGAWVYYQPQPDAPPAHAISSVRPDNVRHVRLERLIDVAESPAQGNAAHRGFVVVLERKSGEWRMMFPVAARADAFQAERLISILEARSTVRYPATDAARYGLDRAVARLTLDGETFIYGALNATTREQYVATREGVYVVPLNYAAVLPRNPDVLLAREVLAKTEVPVRFELGDFSVVLDGGTWRVTPPAVEASADERSAWVDRWRQASAINALRHDGRAAKEHVKVQLADSKTIDIGILQREPELVLVRGDEGVQYHFFGRDAKRLLLPPGTSSEAQGAASGPPRAQQR